MPELYFSYIENVLFAMVAYNASKASLADRSGVTLNVFSRNVSDLRKHVGLG